MAILDTDLTQSDNSVQKRNTHNEKRKENKKHPYKKGGKYRIKRRNSSLDQSKGGENKDELQRQI